MKASVRYFAYMVVAYVIGGITLEPVWWAAGFILMAHAWQHLSDELDK